MSRKSQDGVRRGLAVCCFDKIGFQAGWLVVFCLAVSIGTAFAQEQRPGVLVTGIAQDATGGALPRATVDLIAVPGSRAQTTIADADGIFRFEHVTPGAYDLLATFDGFKPARARVQVGTRPARMVTLVLPLANFAEEITIGDETPVVRVETGANIDATTIDQDALDHLPVMGQDLLGMISRFLDAGAVGTSGVTLLVDGIEMNRLSVPTSAIQQIKINRDPYAAEFSRPGSGRVEVITKPGSRTYHGSASALFRDDVLEARPPLADVRPPEQHRTFEGVIGGPVWRLKATTFTLTARDKADEMAAIVLAQNLGGAIRESVPTPYDYRYVSGSIDHRFGKNNASSLRFWSEHQNQQKLGIGGVALPESAAAWELTERNVSYSHETILSTRLLHQTRLRLAWGSDATTSAIPDRRIVVVDAFTGGGAQADQRRSGHHFTLTDTVSWSPGRHFVKGGLNMPEWSWRRLDDDSNVAGTFYFSSLLDYAEQRPYAFIQQRGNGHVEFVEKVVGAFIQDEIRMRPNLSLSIGLRYYWQNHFEDANNVAPRAAFAFAPSKMPGTVIRGGSGIFYDQIGSRPIQDLVRYDGSHLQRHVITDPSYPDPLQGEQTLAAIPPSLVRLAPDIDVSSRLQYSVSIERQLRKSTSLSLTYTGSRGFDMFRSRDVNAPTPPLFEVRPDPKLGVVRQIESAGRYASQALQIGLRGRAMRFFDGSIQYTLSGAHNDTSGIAWVPPNPYDLSGEYARADFDQRHKLDVIGTVKAGSLFTLGVALAVYSGRPYSITTGHDDFNDGVANERPPGVSRNSLDGPSYADLDLRWSRDLWRRRKSKSEGSILAVGVDVFNVLNRINYTSYVGTLTSPFFGRAIAAEPPRRVQLSLRVRF